MLGARRLVLLSGDLGGLIQGKGAFASTATILAVPSPTRIQAASQMLTGTQLEGGMVIRAPKGPPPGVGFVVSEGTIPAGTYTGGVQVGQSWDQLTAYITVGLLFFVEDGPVSHVTAVSFNGVPQTRIYLNNSANMTLSIWQITNLLGGVINSDSITIDATTIVADGMITFISADRVNPLGVNAIEFGSGLSPSLNLGDLRDQAVFDIVAVRNGATISTITPNNGQTITALNSGTDFSLKLSVDAGQNSVARGWTIANTSGTVNHLLFSTAIKQRPFQDSLVKTFGRGRFNQTDVIRGGGHVTMLNAGRAAFVSTADLFGQAKNTVKARGLLQEANSVSGRALAKEQGSAQLVSSADLVGRGFDKVRAKATLSSADPLVGRGIVKVRGRSTLSMLSQLLGGSPRLITRGKGYLTNGAVLRGTARLTTFSAHGAFLETSELIERSGFALGQGMMFEASDLTGRGIVIVRARGGFQSASAIQGAAKSVTQARGRFQSSSAVSGRAFVVVVGFRGDLVALMRLIGRGSTARVIQGSGQFGTSALLVGLGYRVPFILSPTKLIMDNDGRTTVIMDKSGLTSLTPDNSGSSVLIVDDTGQTILEVQDDDGELIDGRTILEMDDSGLTGG